MPDRYLEIATTDAVKQLQERWGSRATYGRLESGPDRHHQLGPEEIAFIEAQDSFFLASINEAGWPYVQHRGGPPGFLKILNANQLGFPDFKGNRQYLSFGNLLRNPKVSLFIIDYPARTRLKIFGRATLVKVMPYPRNSRSYRPRKATLKSSAGSSFKSKPLIGIARNTSYPGTPWTKSAASLNR